MSGNSFFLACATGLLAMTLSVQAVVPPVPSIPDDLMDGELLGIYKKQIRDRVNWWKQKFFFSNSDKEVISTRNSLLGDYGLYESPNYRYAFAEIALEELMGLLEGKDFRKDDPFRTIKIINVAIALGQMHKNSIQPALEFMVADKNQAIRYIGWEGYRNTRSSLLLAGGKYLNVFAASLKKAIRNEKNPLVLRMAFNAMLLPAPGKMGLDKDMRIATQEQLLQVLKDSWNTLRKGVLTAKEPQSDWVDALRDGVMALGGIGKELGDQASAEKDAKGTHDTRQSLQMMVDMAQSAATTYDRIWKRKDANQKLLIACSKLLLTCEDGLNLITGLKKDYLKNALSAPPEKVGDRGAAVLQAVLNWVDALKKEGVKDPLPHK